MTQQHRPTVSRRAVIAGGLGAATALGSGLAAPSLARADTLMAEYAGRAKTSYNAMQANFYDPATGFYLEQFPFVSGNPYSYVWPFSQATVATEIMAGIPGQAPAYRSAVPDRYRALEAYWNSGTNPVGYDSYLRPPYGGGGDKFYDDNEWIGLSFLLRNNLAGGHDPAAVDKAEQIFDLIIYGWDNDPTHPCPGGVFWTQASWSQDRNTVSNAPGAEIGARLYLLTGRQSRLDWAVRMYDWVRSYMLAPNGLYWDHVDLAGNIQKTQWSYNQGVMIGAGALLYQATGNRSYLDQAYDTAKIALDFYAAGDTYFTQPAEFHAIFFANLLRLSTLRADKAFRVAAAGYADEARSRYQDPATGLYHFDSNPIPLLHQAAMVRIEGMLAWAPGNYGQLT
ncbi:MAG: glycosyl hydrolase [Microlunatus sp.]|nr:glycosyl hydrolase [Microlunatus sp.]